MVEALANHYGDSKNSDDTLQKLRLTSTVVRDKLLRPGNEDARNLIDSMLTFDPERR